ncbi:exodeoxyribonuclease V subunit beta [Pseudoxanthomonas sp. JBR18]|uniref:UvrD-helicase domain-containing protein n=1 Tax=Pseudoxanthomonas sp. JBR18 TaxID=2969308 RepID=UPI002306A0D4|nr:exodeoxyribonuclease V subunit beta [Pseudoxanthomonas sp. JBR18]WCE05865.1 exodeoxyribonuclease V subunit beta [Pseudoxanthomonas sp. JBR18]
MTPADPFLALPLTGTHLIEASAGTGKTFTLATLVTRLVVEQRLRIGQILAVTFTDAATQELRKRIRERLVLAASLVPDTADKGPLDVGAAMAATGPAGNSDVEPALAEPQGTASGESSSPPWRLPRDHATPDEAPDAALSRAIIAAHLQAGDETPSQLKRRLQTADEDVGAAMAATGPAGNSDVDPALAEPQGTASGESSSPPWRLPRGQATPDEAPDAALSRAIIAARLQAGDETPSQLKRRLQAAADEMDLAAIFTIHGFCARVLREHALESGQTFAPPELLANDRALRAELAADLWRSTAADEALAPLLMSMWPGGPDALARDLGELIRQPNLLPPLCKLSENPRPLVEVAARELIAAMDAHLPEAQEAIARAFDGKAFDGRRARRPSFDKAFQTLQAGRELAAWQFDDKNHLDKLLPARMLEFCKDDTRHKVPVSPLFDALHAWAEADRLAQQWLEEAKTHLLHALRDQARTRLVQRKQQLRVQTYDDLIDGVADALKGPYADALVQRLRAQYAVALVDEFQDTDARQWGIFRTVFCDSEATRNASLTPALFLIGDPKQAIYGFRGGDVQTYLQAAKHAQAAPALERNFRSRPAVLAAIEALYTQAGERAFLDDRIRFHRVLPGTQRADADYQRRGANAPALTLWQAPAPQPDDKGKRKPHSAARARELATQACVVAIHQVLSDARAGTATLNGRPVQPGDIAVLVRKHGEATRIQQALAAVGIPAVAAGKQSLFATPEAHELLTLLLALLHPADDGRLRAALATVLLGVDAAGIAALEGDGTTHAQWQGKALAWRERWQRGGPLALVSDLCADNAERLLGLLDGERRLTNYLQLGELLQQADARALGLQGLVDWLGQQLAQADPDDETQLLRLESDARRVQIVTLHKSKGLEYPLVFLPFVGIGGKAPDPGRACVVADEDGQRFLHWKLQPELFGWDAARQLWIEAQRAEDARLLYVGLTRAEHALWIATGDFYNAQQTALAPMLDGLPETAGIVRDSAQPGTVAWLPPLSEGDAPIARPVTRHIAPDWWVYSFTQLANADSGGTDLSTRATVAVAGGSDEPEGEGGDATPQPAEVFDPRFAGNRFGVVLHEALEEGDFAKWRDWQPGDAAPADERRTIETALKGGGYATDELDDGVAVLTTLIGQTLTVALPEGVRLCDVPAEARRAEIEFQFALQPTAIEALLALLHAHGVVRDRHGFGLRRTLEGLMTGLIDLTYTHAGRWYVLDYKSNRLPAYDAAAMQRAMAHSEYDLQALIYTLALHRWLRFRLGDGYDYDRDFGGIRYLFCRGLDATRADSPGVHAQRFAPELIHALDALFAGAAVEKAA